MNKHVHIVSFDVPYPVDYGGIIDVFYTIREFYNSGIYVHLHCFEYGRGRQMELDKYCAEVNYYKRHAGYKSISREYPYIVRSRANDQLLDKLLQDEYPILLEGIHCTFVLNDNRFKNRKIFVRLFNIEHSYYEQLYRSTVSPLKKIYYYFESRQLKKYESKIAQKAIFIAYSQADALWYSTETGAKNVLYLPPLLPFDSVKSKEGIGGFCMYHGNLSVPENEAAALWLLQRVFHNEDLPFVIAGKNPSRRLKYYAHNQPNTCLVANPTEHEMQDLIAKAQINILPSFNNTGIKLKVLNALFNGRHCLVNEAATLGTELKPVCHIATNAEEFKVILRHRFREPFTEKEIKLRETLLLATFNNKNNIKKLIQWLW